MAAMRKKPAGGGEGLTLIEIVIVMFIIGMVMGLGVPRFVQSLKKMELKSVAWKLSAAMRGARTRAVAEKTAVTLLVDNERKSIYAVRGRPEEKEEDGKKAREGDGVEKGDGAVAPPIEIPKGVTVWNGGEREEVTAMEFYPTGSSSGGTFFVAPEESASPEDENGYVVTLDVLSGKGKVEPFADYAESGGFRLTKRAE